MTIKRLAMALVATTLTTPAFAHSGDHAAIPQNSFWQHLTQSPFHIFALASIAIAAGLLVWHIRNTMITRQRTDNTKP